MSHAPQLNLGRLRELLADQQQEQLQALLRASTPSEGARLLMRLDDAERASLFTILPAEDAAQLLNELADSQAAEVLSELPVELAAAIFECFRSNQQADLLALLPDADALLAALSPVTAQRATQLGRHSPNTAGGFMVTEFLAYSDRACVADVINALRANASKYSRWQLQYAYIVDGDRRLVGVLRLRDLLLLDDQDSLHQAMTPDPVRVPAEMPLNELTHAFDRHPYLGVPVVDAANRLLGVVLRADVEEALAEQADRRLLLVSGVLGGDEYRSMNWGDRVLRRAPWLLVSLVLSFAAASVIGLYQETLLDVIALAVFLPVISGMGGNSGNQALAVSIRELSLELVRPHETLWVVGKELIVGLTNGLLLALLVAAIAWLWKRDIRLSAVVGMAIALNISVAACLGGIVPLLLKRWRLDPALAAGPVLAAVNDMCGFLFALVLADLLIPQSSM